MKCHVPLAVKSFTLIFANTWPRFDEKVVFPYRENYSFLPDSFLLKTFNGFLILSQISLLKREGPEGADL